MKKTPLVNEDRDKQRNHS